MSARAAATSNAPNPTVSKTPPMTTDLLAQIMATSPSDPLCSLEPVAEGEIIVGTASENLRRLYNFIDAKVRVFVDDTTKIAGQIERLGETHYTDHDASNVKCCEAFHAEVIKLADQLSSIRRQAQVLGDLFWSFAKLEAGQLLPEGEGCGIREGYQLVRLPRQRNRFTDLLDFFMSQEGNNAEAQNLDSLFGGDREGWPRSRRSGPIGNA